ncbi:MAG TPA: hypothetical protein VLC09_14735 [Polyangiaceae bacterium]|nr:hypothetical protein [Polyangiaceae bacterium]
MSILNNPQNRTLLSGLAILYAGWVTGRRTVTLDAARTVLSLRPARAMAALSAATAMRWARRIGVGAYELTGMGRAAAERYWPAWEVA